MLTTTVLIEPKKDHRAQEFLQRYRDLSVRVQALEEKIERDMSRAASCTSQIKDVMVSGTPNHDRMADAVFDIVDERLQLENDRQECKRALCEIRKAISTVSSERYKTVLTLRYICFLGWDDIADRIYLAKSKVHVAHGRALLEIKNFLDSEIGDEKGLEPVV